jgi:hypothetical protein
MHCGIIAGHQASLAVSRIAITDGLIALGITPVGWVAFLAIGAAASITSYYIDESYVNPAINEYL